MEKDNLDKIVAEIIELVKDVPEEYRQKTYEVLLMRRLLPAQLTPIQQAGSEKTDEKWDVSLPTRVTAFLSTHDLREDGLKKLFVIQKGQTEETYHNKIDLTKRTRAQIDVTLLTALEHALLDGRFVFSFQEIRDRSRALGFYDEHHFKEPFQSYQKLFNGLQDEEEVTLSTEGLSELAEVIKRITHEKG